MHEANADTETEAPSRLRRRWKLIATLVVLVAVAPLIAVRLSLSWRVERARDAIRDAGHPVDTRDVMIAQDRLLRHDVENPNDLLVQADTALRAPDEWLSNTFAAHLGDPHLPVSPELVSDLEAHLAPNAAALGHLHDAADAPYLRNVINLNLDPFELIAQPRPRGMHLAQLLAIEGVVRIAHGDTNGACDTALAAFAIAEAFDDQPTNVGAIFRIKATVVACLLTERLMNQLDLTDAQLRAFDDRLARAADSQLLVHAFRCERALVADLLRHAESEHHFLYGIKPDNPLVTVGHRITGYFEREELDLLRLTTAFIDIAEAPPHRRAERMETAAAIAAEIESRSPMAYTAKRLLLPTVPIHTDMLARIAALRGAIAAARHRLRHGDWPTADQLAPPTDPYTGDPLIYRRDDDRCVIYSVGADGVDQHGADDDVACILRD